MVGSLHQSRSPAQYFLFKVPAFSISLAAVFSKRCNESVIILCDLCMSALPVFQPTRYFCCFCSPQRFFVLDNGILKYSKSPIDVSNPDCKPEANTGQPGLTSAPLEQWLSTNICNTGRNDRCVSARLVTLQESSKFRDKAEEEHMTVKRAMNRAHWGSLVLSLGSQPS